ncbi:MAG: xanthine phosphoribosyltransferase [Treponemataceae bacterium]
MQELQEKIKKDGVVLGGNILKVDSFLNHQIDIDLLNKIGQEFKNRFTNKHITKILTVEASGIAVAAISAQHFNNIPILFAKKNKTKNIDQNSVYSSQAQSFTHGTTYEIIVSKAFLSKDDTVLLIDDFLANGCALEALVDICHKAQANIAGAGIVIEKGFQEGGKRIRSKNIQLESLAIIEKMDANGIIFR